MDLSELRDGLNELLDVLQAKHSQRDSLQVSLDAMAQVLSQRQQQLDELNTQYESEHKRLSLDLEQLRLDTSAKTDEYNRQAAASLKAAQDALASLNEQKAINANALQQLSEEYSAKENEVIALELRIKAAEAKLAELKGI